MYLSLTLAGVACAIAGIWMICGLGWALLVFGVLLFVTGGMGSTREGR